MEYKNKKIAILGYGMEGKDALTFLLEKGAQITVFDKEDVGEKVESVKFITGNNYLVNGLLGFDIIVRSPGIYRYSTEIVEAEKSGVVISSPIKIFFEECKSKIIGVTGTKGKGTTTTLIKEILENDGREVFLVGNIGKPYLEILSKLSNESLVIMEMSSFQLIDLTISPHISVVLNITSDHMDWHKDISEYVDAKKSIVKFQNENDFAVINEEYETSKSFAGLTKAKVIFFSKKSLDSKFKEKLLLRGEHNLENIAAAVSVTKILNVNDEKIKEVVSNFKGLEHRLELVKKVGTITFYNDSFATGPQSTIAAIKSFVEPETLILGGSGKDLAYTELGNEIAKHGNIKNIVLIGAIRDQIKNAIVKAGFKFNIIDLGTSNMDEIVKKAYEITPENGVVILSPAAASFDMFKNYKDRGNQFKEAVLSIKGGIANAR